METKKIILDCDPGMDDSMAIVMAVKSPKLEVMAVTTVNGNYPVDITCVNARKVLEQKFRLHEVWQIRSFEKVQVILLLMEKTVRQRHFFQIPKCHYQS